MPGTPPLPTLLIAVTGLPGEGKTRLLAEFAARQAALGVEAEGFLATAYGRPAAGQGAAEYRLTLLRTGEELPWAIRNEALDPPYLLQRSTFERLARWAVMLPSGSPLVLMDEFARFESRGEGLMPLWPAVTGAAPRIVILAVRAGLTGAIEERLGRKFDLHIAAGAPDAMERLLSACSAYGEWTRIGLYGGSAGALEMSVGTALHSLHVPLRGLAMSSLQSAMMTLTGCGLTEPARVVWVPFISAGLKALSPAGNRLRPMVAIAVQGLLYGLAVLTLGWNAAGVLLGGALVGAWAALQGFFLQYLLLGGDLLQAYDAAVAWLARHGHVTAPGLPWLLSAWTLLHAAAAGGLTLAVWRRRAPPRLLHRLIAHESRELAAAAPVTPPRPVGRLGRIGRELLRWQFWLPLAVVSAVLLATGRDWESVAWLALRFVAVGTVVLALLSLLSPMRLAEALHRRGWWGPALALRTALNRPKA